MTENNTARGAGLR